MKAITQITHNLILRIGLDSTIAKLTEKVPVFHKFIPTNGEYSVDKCIVVQRGGATFNLHLNDYMQWHIFANIKEPLWNFAWKFLKKESVILDVGANVGAFSLKTARYLQNQKADFNVHAFEPNKTILTLLDDNLTLNPELSDCVSTYPLALSDKIGTLNFESNTVNSGSSKLSTNSKGSKVEVMTIDAFVKSKKLKRVDLLKIDVEGHEPRILKGAKQTLSTHKPIIILEITDQWFQSEGSSASEVIATLSKLGYSFYSDISGKAKIFDPDTQNPLPFQFNILAIYGFRG